MPNIPKDGKWTPKRGSKRRILKTGQPHCLSPSQHPSHWRNSASLRKVRLIWPVRRWYLGIYGRPWYSTRGVLHCCPSTVINHHWLAKSFGVHDLLFFAKHCKIDSVCFLSKQFWSWANSQWLWPVPLENCPAESSSSERASSADLHRCLPL